MKDHHSLPSLNCGAEVEMNDGLIHDCGNVACAIRWGVERGTGGRREERFLLKSACNEFGAMLAVECSWQRVGGDWERGGTEGD